LKLENAKKEKMKPFTSIVVSNQIKRINAFSGYCEIVEKRVAKRELSKMNSPNNLSRAGSNLG